MESLRIRRKRKSWLETIEEANRGEILAGCSEGMPPERTDPRPNEEEEDPGSYDRPDCKEKS